MLSLSEKCGAGGWTLVMKLDGDKVKNVIRKSMEVLYFPSYTGENRKH